MKTIGTGVSVRLVRPRLLCFTEDRQPTVPASLLHTWACYQLRAANCVSVCRRGEGVAGVLQSRPGFRRACNIGARRRKQGL